MLYVQLKRTMETLEAHLKKKDAERKEFKSKHGIMTQQERDAIMKRQQQLKQ